jgi:hypothetical protein
LVDRAADEVRAVGLAVDVFDVQML